MNLFTILLLLLLLFLIIIINFLYINYTTHLNITNKYLKNEKFVSDYKHFKKNFFKYKWKRDIYYKKSFFPLNYDDRKNFYIHASIVKINGVKYKFNLISFIRYSLFINKNKTTNENVKNVVNNIKYLRKEKLKKIKWIY